MAYLDSRVERELTFDGIKVAGIDVAETHGHCLVLYSLCAPRRGSSRRHKQQFTSSHLSGFFSERNKERHQANKKVLIEDSNWLR